MSNVNSDNIEMKACRICLKNNDALCPLFRYKLSGNYAEMLTSLTNIKVEAHDGLPDKICSKCCCDLERAYLLKTRAERSDKILQRRLKKMQESIPTKKIAFNSISDIKTEIGPLKVKQEPQLEIEVLVNENGVAQNPMETVAGKNIVIANTVIKKVESSDNAEDFKKRNKGEFFNEDSEISWKKIKSEVINKDNADDDDDYLGDDFFNDNGSDIDYVPPKAKSKKIKNKIKRPNIPDTQINTKSVSNKIKVIKKLNLSVARDKIKMLSDEIINEMKTEAPGTIITCFPILKNGSRGPPILLKRPKDATVLKIHSNYKPRRPYNRSATRDGPKEIDKSLKLAASMKKSLIKPREKLVCPVCGILTFTLGNHMTTHQEKKRFPCTHCPRSFGQRGNLAIHMKQHTGIRDQVCEICGASFFSQKSLIRHNLIHKGERPYGCDLCNKTFIARCDLNRHLRIHSGYKPYKCGTCTMSFNAKHQLQNHERMHTGERPYTCQVCNVAFSYKVNLNNHVFKVHGINLKFKSIHIVTEDILRREQSMAAEARTAVSHIMPTLNDVPPPAAHETIESSREVHHFVV